MTFTEGILLDRDLPKAGTTRTPRTDQVPPAERPLLKIRERSERWQNARRPYTEGAAKSLRAT
jgi:hypothetical protein